MGMDARSAEGEGAMLDYHERRACWLLWAIEIGMFALIVGIGAFAYTVSP